VGIVINWDTAESVKPSSKITVGRTVDTPQPPMACVIHIMVKVAVVGSLKMALTCAEFHVLSFALG
jgi:hypothetical protein